MTGAGKGLLHTCDLLQQPLVLFLQLQRYFGDAAAVGMRPASPMERRKRDFFEWEFTKKMNAVGRSS